MELTKQNGWQLAAIQAGGAICLPILVVGHQIAKHYGEHSAFLAIVVGNALLLLAAGVCALYSVEKRLTTVQCATICFGNQGKGFFAAAMLCSMVGWFGIQLQLMGSSFDELTHLNWGRGSLILLGGAMTLLGTRGIRGVGLLANLSLPLLILTIGYAVYKAGVGIEKISTSHPLTLGGISLVLASSIAAVIDLPTFFRFARTKKDALVGVGLLFAIVLPLLEGVGVLLYSYHQGENFLEVLLSAHPSPFWELWVLVFVILAGWTTNSANLYSAIICLQSAVPKLSCTMGALIVGGAGTMLSCFDLTEHLEVVLQPLGIVLGSMGAVLIVTFLRNRNEPLIGNLIGWGGGILAGLVSLGGLPLTDIAVLDAFLGSLICMGVVLALESIRKAGVYP